MQNQKISFKANGDIARFGCVTSFGTEADSANPAHQNHITGVTEGRVASGAYGDSTVVGLLFLDTWAWTPGAAIYLNGTALSETAPNPMTDFVQQVGMALTPQSILVRI